MIKKDYIADILLDINSINENFLWFNSDRLTSVMKWKTSFQMRLIKTTISSTLYSLSCLSQNIHNQLALTQEIRCSC